MAKTRLQGVKNININIRTTTMIHTKHNQYRYVIQIRHACLGKLTVYFWADNNNYYNYNNKNDIKDKNYWAAYNHKHAYCQSINCRRLKVIRPPV